MENNRYSVRTIHPFATKGSTCVLVTNQFQSERLIHAGRVISDITGTDLCVLNIQNSATPTNPQALQHLFNVSSQNGAAMELLYSDNAFISICQYIKDNKISCVISGMPAGANSILHKIWNNFQRVHFFTVNDDGKMEEVIHRSTHGVAKKAEEIPAVLPVELELR